MAGGEGVAEDEMVGWHHRLNRHGFGWTPGVGDRQGGLACHGSWCLKESDTTERLNWTEFVLIHETNISGSYAKLLLQHLTLLLSPVTSTTGCCFYFGSIPSFFLEFLLQEIFLTQELNPHLLHWQVDSLTMSYLGSPGMEVQSLNHWTTREVPGNIC